MAISRIAFALVLVLPLASGLTLPMGAVRPKMKKTHDACPVLNDADTADLYKQHYRPPQSSVLKKTVLAVHGVYADELFTEKMRVLESYRPYFLDVVYIQMRGASTREFFTPKRGNQTFPTPKTYDCGEDRQRSGKMDQNSYVCMAHLMDHVRNHSEDLYPGTPIDGFMFLHADFWISPRFTLNKDVDALWGASWTSGSWSDWFTSGDKCLSSEEIEEVARSNSTGERDSKGQPLSDNDKWKERLGYKDALLEGMADEVIFDDLNRKKVTQQLLAGTRQLSQSTWMRGNSGKGGTIKTCYGWSDMYYVPMGLSDKWTQLMRHFGSHSWMIEFAVPTAQHMLSFAGTAKRVQLPQICGHANGWAVAVAGSGDCDAGHRIDLLSSGCRKQVLGLFR